MKPFFLIIMLLFVLPVFCEENRMDHPSGKQVFKEHYTMLTQVPYVNLHAPINENDLQGRLILLDFWTYCCINCLHAMEDLKEMEKEFVDKQKINNVSEIISTSLKNEKLNLILKKGNL